MLSTKVLDGSGFLAGRLVVQLILNGHYPKNAEKTWLFEVLIVVHKGSGWFVNFGGMFSGAIDIVMFFAQRCIRNGFVSLQFRTTGICILLLFNRMDYYEETRFWTAKNPPSERGEGKNWMYAAASTLQKMMVRADILKMMVGMLRCLHADRNIQSEYHQIHRSIHRMDSELKDLLRGTCCNAAGASAICRAVLQQLGPLQGNGTGFQQSAIKGPHGTTNPKWSLTQALLKASQVPGSIRPATRDQWRLRLAGSLQPQHRKSRSMWYPICIDMFH